MLSRHVKLLNGEIRMRSRKNVVQARSFFEMLEQALRRYQNRAIEAAQVIEQVRADAAAQASAANGFAGDPFTPVDGRFYGHLASAHDPTVRRVALPPPPAASAPSPVPVDSRVEVLLLRIARRQDVDRLRVSVRLAEAGRVTARAWVRVRGARKRVRSRAARARAAAGQTVRLRLRFSRPDLRRLKRALRRAARVRARVTVKLSDAADNSRTMKRRVRLRR